jgi:phytoene synthase
MASDATYCERLTRRHARTFHLASLLLPGVRRRATYALYAFCRGADDIVDRSPAVPGHDPAGELAAYRRRLEAALAGMPEGPVFRELAWCHREFQVPASALHEVVDGVAADLTTTEWATWRDLEHYCQGVAGSVGELCAAVFATSAPRGDPRLVAPARSLGVAMQLTNILRDVGEDALRGRCYLPADELAQAGLTPRDILAGLPETDPRWLRFVQPQIARARAYYEDAMPAIALLDPEAQRCAHACAVGYARILHVIERNRYNVFSKRASLGWVERTAVLGSCLFSAHPLPTGMKRPLADDATAASAA